MLPIPELVPFRMTRDLLDPILVQGIKGSLAYKAAEALDKTRKNKDVWEEVALECIETFSGDPRGGVGISERNCQ